MTRLSVNLNKVALLRNSRTLGIPSVVRAGIIAIEAGARGLTVRPVIKADRDCASAAAASVIAKVARDAFMTQLHDEVPAYCWNRNKGYASPDHREAIREYGISAHHRASWSITDAPTLF